MEGWSHGIGVEPRWRGGATKEGRSHGGGGTTVEVISHHYWTVMLVTFCRLVGYCLCVTVETVDWGFMGWMERVGGGDNSG